MHNLERGLALARLFATFPLQTRVILILCVVPMWLFASFASSIFDLNRNLANSLVMVNTAVFLTCVPPLPARYL